MLNLLSVYIKGILYFKLISKTVFLALKIIIITHLIWLI